jgi:hypothetical protein
VCLQVVLAFLQVLVLLVPVNQALVVRVVPVLLALAKVHLVRARALAQAPVLVLVHLAAVRALLARRLVLFPVLALLHRVHRALAVSLQAVVANHRLVHLAVNPVLANRVEPKNAYTN